MKRQWTLGLLLGAAVALAAGCPPPNGSQDAGDSAQDGGPEGDAAVDQDAGEQADAGWGPPIDGLGISLDQLLDFLGGRRGVLVWVNAGGQAKLLDFRGDDPAVVTTVDGAAVINPLVSPDGTRLVYSQGLAGGAKTINVKLLDPEAPPQMVAFGDVGYWNIDGSEESIVYCDWADKETNGAGGQTYQQALVPGTTELRDDAVVIHDRAMDAGPNASLSWLGQVYNNLWAYDVVNGVEYTMDKFYLLDGGVADHQCCNGSMAPDTSARLMTLVIPHDFVRVYSYSASADRFDETSRLVRPDGMVEWEFPEWSSHPDYFTAVLMANDYRKRLFIAKMQEGEGVPERVEITDDSANVSYSHLWLAP